MSPEQQRFSRRRFITNAASIGIAASQLVRKPHLVKANTSERTQINKDNNIPWALTDLAISPEALQKNTQRVDRMAYVYDEIGRISSLYALRSDSSVFRSSHNKETGKQEPFAILQQSPLYKCLTLAAINTEEQEGVFVGGYTADEDRFMQPGLFMKKNDKDYQLIPLTNETGNVYKYGYVIALKQIPSSSDVLVHSIHEGITSYGVYDQKNNSYDHITGYGQYFPLPNDLYIDPTDPNRLFVSGLTYDGMSTIAITELKIDLKKHEITWARQYNKALRGSEDMIVERGEDGFGKTEYILTNRYVIDKNNREYLQRSIYTLTRTDKSVFDYGGVMDNRLRDSGIEGSVIINAFTKTDNGFWLAGNYKQNGCIDNRPLAAYFPEDINPPVEKIVLYTFDDIPSVYGLIYHIEPVRFASPTNKLRGEDYGVIATFWEGGPVFIPSNINHEPIEKNATYLANGLEKGPSYDHYRPSPCKITNEVTKPIAVENFDSVSTIPVFNLTS